MQQYKYFTVLAQDLEFILPMPATTNFITIATEIVLSLQQSTLVQVSSQVNKVKQANYSMKVKLGFE